MLGRGQRFYKLRWEVYIRTCGLDKILGDRDFSTAFNGCVFNLGTFRTHVRSGRNEHYFHMIGDKLINPIVGVLYTQYQDFLLSIFPLKVQWFKQGCSNFTRLVSFVFFSSPMVLPYEPRKMPTNVIGELKRKTSPPSPSSWYIYLHLVDCCGKCR